MSSVLSAVDALFQHALGHQLVLAEFQDERGLHVFLLRKPALRVGVVLVTAGSSWYLKRAARGLLHALSRTVRARVNADAVVMEQHELDALLDPLVHQLFPYFEVIRADHR